MDNMFADAESGASQDQAPAASTDQSPPEEKAPEQEQDQQASFVVPKTALAGQELQPGDKVTCRVVRVQPDEVEMTLDAKESAGAEAPEPGEATPPPPGGGMGENFD